MMEAFTITVEAIHLTQALKENLQAAKGCTKDFDRAINIVEGIWKQLDNLDVKLTSSEDELFADWKVDCEDILTQLHAHSGPSFELHDVGFRKAVAALCRRLCFDPKEADRLNIRVLTNATNLGIIFGLVQLARR